MGLQDVQTDVAFAASLAPAPNSKPPTVSASPTSEPDVTDFDFGKEFLDRLPPTRTATRACPEAELTAAPSQEASLNAIGVPVPGVYRWNRKGTQQLTTPPVKFPIAGFEKRLIRNVQRTSADVFTFEAAQPNFGTGEIVVTTFQVRTKATAERVGTTDQRVGELDRGLAIAKYETFNANTGQSVGSFEPEPPVLLLPLPVVPGERFQGLGVDPRSLVAMQIDGRVTKRQRVDACGEFVDGWAVEATETFSAPDRPGTPYTYNFVVATQRGAQLISEHIETTTPQGSINATFSLGQLKPDPLPKASAKADG